MAFNPGGTNYQGFLDQRRMADTGVTEALKAKGEAEKAARIRKSGQRSGLQKLGSAVVRGAAAYYTGGMSDTMGGGAMIDEAMLGTDEEGKAVRNEYGEMVGMASQIGGAMSAKKGAEAAKKLEMQSLKDDAMQTRLDNLDPSGVAGREFAMNRSRKDADNLKALQAGQKGSLGGLFQKDIEGINYEPTTVGDWEMPPKPSGGPSGGPPSLQTPSGSAQTPSVPQIELPEQLGGKDELKSAAQKFETSGGSPTLEAQAGSEKDRIIAGLAPPPSEQRDPNAKDWGQEQGFIKSKPWNQYTNSQKAVDEGSSLLGRQAKAKGMFLSPSANW